MKTPRSRTRAIKISSINKPDPDLVAELLVPLLLDFHLKGEKEPSAAALADFLLLTSAI